jgi:hypothetical protein
MIGMTGRVKAGAAIAAAALGAGGAIAVGSVPDSNGTVHACYALEAGGGTLPAPGPNVRVIDPASQTCDAASEHAFTVGAQGPQGSQGIQGPPGPQGDQGLPGGTGTLEQPGPAGHASVSYQSGGRARAVATLEFDVLEIQIGVTHGAGIGTATKAPPKFLVTLPEDQNAQKLALDCASGKHFPQVVLKLLTGGGKAIETFTLTDAYVDSVQFGSHGGDHAPEAFVEFVARSAKTEVATTTANRLPAILFSTNRKVKLKP